MNLNQVKEAMPHLFRNKLTGMLIGQHGVGKSTSIREYTEEKGIGFIDLRLGQMEVGDLLGLPEIINQDGHKVTVFARPKWFPVDGEGVLFLDEINRSKRDVIQAVFQLVLDRKLHDYVLPPGWQVVAAMNPSTEDYQTLDLSDKAFLDRFCHIKITSSYQNFIDYGNTKGFNKTVLNFISNHPAMLRGVTQEFDLKVVEPSDRSWEAVSRLSADKEIPEDMLNELVTGLVGIEAATAFMSWKKKAEKPIEGMAVLGDYSKVRKQVLEQADASNYRPDLLNETKQQIMEYIKDKKEDEELNETEYGNLVAFLLDMPSDLFVDLTKQLFKVPKLFIKLADQPDIDKRAELCLKDKKDEKPVVEEKV